MLLGDDVDSWRDKDDATVIRRLVAAGTDEFFASQLVLLRDHPPVATEITRRLAAP
jgi:hypothetical protein